MQHWVIRYSYWLVQYRKGAKPVFRQLIDCDVNFTRSIKHCKRFYVGFFIKMAFDCFKYPLGMLRQQALEQRYLQPYNQISISEEQGSDTI